MSDKVSGVKRGLRFKEVPGCVVLYMIAVIALADPCLYYPETHTNTQTAENPLRQ